MTSSSVVISDALKTLDMSLPSYDDISDATASVETVKSLYVEPTQEEGGFLGGGPKRMSGSEKASKKKEAAAAKQKAREAFEKENFAGSKVEVVDMSVPNYDQSTAQKQKSAFSL